MTFWDSEFFAPIDGRSRKNIKHGLAPVIRLNKRELLPLPQDTLTWLMTNGRSLAIQDALAAGSTSAPLSLPSQDISDTPTDLLSPLSSNIREKIAAVRLCSI